MARFHHSIRLRKFLVATLLLVPAPAPAQLLGRLPLQTLPLRDTISLVPLTAVTERVDAITTLLRRHPRTLERIAPGEAAVRGEVLALAPDDAALAAARAVGFSAVAEENDALGLQLVTLRAPTGVGTRAALAQLRRLDPTGSYDFNHIFVASAAPSATGTLLPHAPPADAPGARIGLIDSGVATRHPAFATARLQTRGFAGQLLAAPHGTAVASLLVGPDGAARGSLLFAADIYGGAPTGGSARAIAAALGWLAGERVGVVNLSLVGPANSVLKAAVDATRARGTLIVAAVGNDGPAGKPLYPAAYPGVVAVTAVDSGGRLLPEAGRADHVDFAALGITRAADPAGGYTAVRGTSFAAPLVAGRLAQIHPLADPARAITAVANLARDEIPAPRR